MSFLVRWTAKPVTRGRVVLPHIETYRIMTIRKKGLPEWLKQVLAIAFNALAKELPEIVKTIFEKNQ